MINKLTIIVALSSLAFICTTEYAQGWKDNWINSPLSARQSESKLRWNKDKWQKSPSYGRNYPYIISKKRPVASDRWQNRSNKRKWSYYSPLYWRNSELRYKNTINRYERESVIQEVRVWVPSDGESEKAPVPEEKKEYAKAQIETITEEAETVSEEAPNNLGHTDNYFTVIGGKQTFRLEKNVQKTVHMTPGGLMEIYSSGEVTH